MKWHTNTIMLSSVWETLTLFSNPVCCDIEVERLLDNYMLEVGITEEQFLEASSDLTANKTLQVTSCFIPQTATSRHLKTVIWNRYPFHSVIGNTFIPQSCAHDVLITSLQHV